MNPRNRLLPLFLLLLGVLGNLVRPGLATDDRDNITPTQYRVYTGQSFHDIGVQVQNGFRIVDIKADDQFASTFTVTYVHNSGAYAIAWWYLIGVDGTTLSNFVNQNSLRPTKVIAWDGGGGTTVFAAVMESNTGANARAWWWYSGLSPQSFFNAAIANNARPVSFDEYRIGTSDQAIGVMISNTGADYRPWWMYYGQSFASIGTLIGQNQARLYSLQQTLSGSFNFIMVQDSVGPWYYWVGLNSQQLLDTAGNLGCRVYDLQRVNGTFNALMLRNDNDLERRVGDLMRSASDGQLGVYLKRVGGPVLASFQGNRVFEPASTMKTLIHYYAMDQVRLGTVSLASPTTVYTGSSGSCPQTTGPVTESLGTVLWLMMENSDNNRTMAAETRFGRSNINAAAQILGMSSTRIQHTLGCGGPLPNELTLADLGRLHEAVANGALGLQRANFYDLMLEFGDNYAGGELNQVIAQEAASVGLSAAQVAAFRSNCRQAFKGGAYTFLGPTREYRSWGAWISLPFYVNTGIQAQEYVTGAFVDAASNGGSANTAFNRGAAEVLRGEIHAAMLTWRDHVSGSWSAFGTGCQGTNGIPLHSGSPATPNITMSLDWSVAGARPSTLAILVLGYSRTLHGSTALPYEMSSLGMPGCRLYSSITFTGSMTTSTAGTGHFLSTMPNDPALINLHLYSQFAVFDPAANSLGVAWSNALDLLLGGQL